MPAELTAPQLDQRRWSEAFGDGHHAFPAGAPRVVRRPLTLSILMPVYNEERTLRKAIETVLSQRYPVDIELRVVDDGSTDASRTILDEMNNPRMFVHRHPRNLGKGAALVSAAMCARGTYIVPFDADLEYSAADLPRMLEPIIAGRCEVVFGTRIFGMYSSYQSYGLAFGNRAMTLATNLLFNSYLTDVHTCLKLMPLELFLSLDLRERGFGLDAEVVARILQRGIRPFEVPVSYYGRSVAEGKKITWRDGVHCMRVLGRVRRGVPLDIAPGDDFPAPIGASSCAMHTVADANNQNGGTTPSVSDLRNEERDTARDVVSAP